MYDVALVNMLVYGSVPLPGGVRSVKTLRKLSFAGHMARALLRRISPDSIRFFEDSRAIESLAQAANIILFDYKGVRQLARRIDSLSSDLPRRKIIYFWNKIDKPSDISDMPHGWELWTFDPSDADLYGMRYAGSFCFPQLYNGLAPAHTACDLYFVGHDKGRFGSLRKLMRNNPDIDIRARFVSQVRSRFSPRYSRFIPYGQCLREAASSKALLDWCVDGQEGLSQRVFEAMALGKKLVTNNKGISAYPFYDLALVFIAPDTSSRDYKGFLSEEAKWPEGVLEPYAFENWLNRNLGRQ